MRYPRASLNHALSTNELPHPASESQHMTETRAQDEDTFTEPAKRPTKLPRWLEHSIFWAVLGVPSLINRITSKVGNPPFFDNDRFPWAAEIEAGWPDIREELDALLSEEDSIPAFHDVAPSQAGLATGRDWLTFFFYGMGARNDENCRRCPKTAALVERIPGMTTAFFSIMSPGKELKAHRGSFNAFLRYHMGIKIPDSRLCYMTVHGTTKRWEEGKSLIFDDRYIHSAGNLSDENRVVLFVDFLRPVPAPVEAMNRFILRLAQSVPALQEANENLIKWNAAHRPAGK